MIGFLGKKVANSFIYNKNGFITNITIVSIYNFYTFKFFNRLNNYFLIFSYFFNYIFYFDNCFLKQFHVSRYDFLKFSFLGKRIPLNIFYINQYVDIFGISIGKGFSGVLKRHNFKSGDATHGNSKAHKKPGSIGMCQDPGRVYPGKKMPGRLGGKKKNIKNLKILKIDFDYNIFFIKGTVPGFLNSNIIIYPSTI